MAKKYNPKQTVENILTVSAKLFEEKGYEKTSMQDIVDALGMSKGAIFHHFKSKEDIFSAVIARLYEYFERTLNQWIEEMCGLSAKEKLMGILENNIKDQRLQSLNKVLATKIKSPHFIVAQMLDYVNKSAPIIADIMREGLEDGSISTEFPDECAEVFLLLINVWCDHRIFECDLSRLTRRMKFLQQSMRQMGADIIRDGVITEYMQFVEEAYERN